MGSTPTYGFRYPDSNNTPDVPKDIRNLADDVESEVARIDNALVTDGYRLLSTIVYTSSGSFTKANFPGIRAIRVRAVGGGASGGGAQTTDGTQNSEGAGGGGGGYCEKWILESELSSSETVTVGTGGSGSSAGNFDGNDGGDSWVGTHFTAGGGKAGTGGPAGSGENASSGGNGGTATGGDINIPGDDGGNGRRITGITVRANFGGGSQLSGIAVSVPTSSDGRTGRPYGGGSSGARNGTSQSARGSTAGADGAVIIEVYI